MKKRKFAWSLVEMGSRKPTPSAKGANRRKREDVSSDDLSGKKIPCEFSLYYSFPKLSDRKPRGKNILFIPGGPGTIPTLDQSAANKLELLESHHNIAYFHLRGSGLSEIHKSNKYDRFLRADYVVEDIEKLRVRLLGNEKPWDAIWGESHGCLIAQRYAHRYGTARVKKLVLVAPPSRSINDTHGPRRNMIASNLEAILKYYRGTASKSKTADGVSEISNRENPNNDDAIVNLTNNFGFLPLQSEKDISNKLESILKDLEDRYGSINFVIEYCKELKARDDYFKTCPYPEAFFKALRQLQFNGRPVHGLEFSDRTKRLHVDAAMLIAYHLMSEINLKARTGHPVFLGDSPYAQRLDIARADIHDDELQSPKSLRDYWVFGVYDGISRWALKIMDEQITDHGFFRSQDIAKVIAKSAAGPVARELAGKIGIVPGEIYPWNAGRYKHNVPTLILRGRADSVTAGGQAESFFEDGLANKDDSVLMEIPGMGHIWRTSMPQAETGGKILQGPQVLQILVDEFLAKHSASAFLNDTKVNAIINAMGIWWQSKGHKLAKPRVGLQRSKKKLLDTIMNLRRRYSAMAVDKNGKPGAEAPKIKISRPRPNN